MANAPVAAAHCALIAATQELPQAEAWIRWSKEHYPDHVMTRIDTACAECLLDYRQENYEPIPAIAKQFVADSQRLRRKEFPLQELVYSNLTAGGIGHARKITVLWALRFAAWDGARRA